MGLKPRARRREPLTLAVPKGRVLSPIVDLFRAAGYDISSVLDKRSRRLTHDCGDFQVWVLRGVDVPTYVAHGAADVGVVGSDILCEHPCDVFEPLDLAIGQCRMVLAEPAHRPATVSSVHPLRIATKYPIHTRQYLDRVGQSAEIISLSGAVELGPLTGLCDRIVDITETGETLRQNGLIELETIGEISSRLIVNPARLKLRAEPLLRLIDRLGAQLV